MSVFNNLIADKTKKMFSFFLFEIVGIAAILALGRIFTEINYDGFLGTIIVVSIMATGVFGLVLFIQSEAKWTKNKYQMIPISEPKFSWLNQLTSLIQMILFGLLQVVINIPSIIKIVDSYGTEMRSSISASANVITEGSGLQMLDTYFGAINHSGNMISINWTMLVLGLVVVLISGYFLNYATWTLFDLLALSMENVVNFKGSRIIFFAVFYIAFAVITGNLTNFISYQFPNNGSMYNIHYGIYLLSLMFVIFGALINWLNSWLYTKFVNTTK